MIVIKFKDSNELVHLTKLTKKIEILRRTKYPNKTKLIANQTPKTLEL